jgi:ferredoxin
VDDPAGGRKGRQAFPLADGGVVDGRRLGPLFRRCADPHQAIGERQCANDRLHLAFTTYALAGHMREQVCVYMCPWPRIQAALTDEYALNVTYRYDRGEPRGSIKKNALLRKQGLPAGDCIDCLQCVHVCPTGVDIRDGSNLGCIQCGLCIDACDRVMEKIGRPTRLIAYDNDINIRRRLEGKPSVTHIVRPRTLVYAALIAVVGGIMLYTLATRSMFGVSVIQGPTRPARSVSSSRPTPRCRRPPRSRSLSASSIRAAARARLRQTSSADHEVMR